MTHLKYRPLISKSPSVYGDYIYRTESNQTVINTLVAKGWVIYTPEPIVEQEVPLTPMQILERDGVEVEDGVILAASPIDIDMWTRTQVQLDSLHEQARLNTEAAAKLQDPDAQVLWETIAGPFNETPFTVLKKDKTPWVTTIGQIRKAITVVGSAYYTAWVNSQ
jgi:hypothetical protein